MKEAVDYHHFMEEVKKGNRPTLAQLRELNQLKKKGYTEVILKEDEESNKYVAAIMEELQITHDEIVSRLFEIDDTTDRFNGYYQVIEEKI